MTHLIKNLNNDTHEHEHKHKSIGNRKFSILSYTTANLIQFITLAAK